MFPLLETIKIIDGKLQNIERHQFRFEASYFKLYKEIVQMQLQDMIQIPETYQKGVVKLRFLYNKTDCFCQFEHYEPRQITILKAVADDNINYSMKWVDRKPLEKLLQQKQNADDILIIKNGRITDTSYTNIAFYNGTEWHTPKYPLLYGTARARLIAEKKINPVDILLQDLAEYQSFKLFNAMLDFEIATELPVSAIIDL